MHTTTRAQQCLHHDMRFTAVSDARQHAGKQLLQHASLPPQPIRVREASAPIKMPLLFVTCSKRIVHVSFHRALASLFTAPPPLTTATSSLHTSSPISNLSFPPHFFSPIHVSHFPMRPRVLLPFALNLFVFCLRGRALQPNLGRTGDHCKSNAACLPPNICANMFNPSNPDGCRTTPEDCQCSPPSGKDFQECSSSTVYDCTIPGERCARIRDPSGEADGKQYCISCKALPEFLYATPVDDVCQADEPTGLTLHACASSSQCLPPRRCYDFTVTSARRGAFRNASAEDAAAASEPTCEGGASLGRDCKCTLPQGTSTCAETGDCRTVGEQCVVYPIERPDSPSGRPFCAACDVVGANISGTEALDARCQNGSITTKPSPTPSPTRTPAVSAGALSGDDGGGDGNDSANLARGLEPCKTDDECEGRRVCRRLNPSLADIGECAGSSSCRCTSERCVGSGDCEKNDRCMRPVPQSDGGNGTSRTAGVCVSCDGAPSEIPLDLEPVDGGEGRCEAECIAVATLSSAGVSRGALVYRRHRLAWVLCARGGGSVARKATAGRAKKLERFVGCATANHIVTSNSVPMTMGTYCARPNATCVWRKMLVNSPRMRWGLRARVGRQGAAEGELEFTAFAARWGTAAEMVVLGTLVRAGL